MSRELHNGDLETRKELAVSVAEKMLIEKASPVLAEQHLAFRNLGDLKFEDVSAAWGLNLKGVSFGAAFGDLDGDGNLDLAFANYEGGITLLRNEADQGHSIVVALRGTRSNRFGVGSVVRIETDSGPQVRTLVLARGVLSSSEPILHFGVGTDTRIRRMTVAWPSGHVQEFADLAVDRRFTVTEPAARRLRPRRRRVRLAVFGGGVGCRLLALLPRGRGGRGGAAAAPPDAPEQARARRLPWATCAAGGRSTSCGGHARGSGPGALRATRREPSLSRRLARRSRATPWMTVPPPVRRRWRRCERPPGHQGRKQP